MDFENYFLQQLELERIYHKDETELPEYRLKHEIIFRKMIDIYEEFKRLEHNLNCEQELIK